MGEEKVVIPEGMLSAGRAAYSGYVTAEEGARRILNAAFYWMKENPIVPTLEQYRELLEMVHYHMGDGNFQKVFAEWQRRMFLSSEPEFPKEIKDYIGWCDVYFEGHPQLADLKNAMCGAFRRGQHSKEVANAGH